MAPARADDRSFRDALERWRAPFRELENAMPEDIVQLSVRVAQSEAKGDAAVRDAWPESGAGQDFNAHGLRDEIGRENLRAIEAAYARATPSGRRALIRMSAVIGGRFQGGVVPRYARCGNGPRDFLHDGARELAWQWIRENPNVYLGLLDDLDPSVAETAMGALSKTHADEVTDRLREWVASPVAWRRGIVASRMPQLPEDAWAKAEEALLEDRVPAIREEILEFLQSYDGKRLEVHYAALRSKGVPRSSPRRWALLALGWVLYDPTVVEYLAMGIRDPDPSVRVKALEAAIRMKAKVPEAALRAALRDSSAEVREQAYEQAGRQGLSFDLLWRGRLDREEEVRRTAIFAASRTASTVQSLKTLIHYAEAHGWDGIYLGTAVKRIGSAGHEEILALAASPKSESRRAFIQAVAGYRATALLPAVERLATDPDVSVRTCLVSEAEFLPKASAQRVLARLLADADAGVREAAETSLRRLNSPED